jgi:hypothetical protein
MKAIMRIAEKTPSRTKSFKETLRLCLVFFDDIDILLACFELNNHEVIIRYANEDRSPFGYTPPGGD